MNSCNFTGNIGQEPRIKVIDSGFTIAEFSLATRDKKKDGDKWVDHTEWVPVKALGKTAELVNKYLGKGSKVGIVGKFKTDSWETKGGEKRYKSYILCDQLEFLSSKGDNESKPKQESKELDLDDIPF